jgi:hypothetical protein
MNNQDLVLIERKEYLNYLNNDLKEIEFSLYNSGYGSPYKNFYDSLLKKRNLINSKIKELTI